MFCAYFAKFDHKSTETFAQPKEISDDGNRKKTARTVISMRNDWKRILAFE